MKGGSGTKKGGEKEFMTPWKTDSCNMHRFSGHE